jgi:hypothetical protein
VAIKNAIGGMRHLEIVLMMTLDELIEGLTEIRQKIGSDAPIRIGTPEKHEGVHRSVMAPVLTEGADGVPMVIIVVGDIAAMTDWPMNY